MADSSPVERATTSRMALPDGTVVVVRRARTDDLPAAAAIYNHEVEHTTNTATEAPLTPEEFGEEFSLEGEKYGLWVALIDKNVFEKRRDGPHRDGEGAVPVAESGPLPHGRGSDKAQRKRSQIVAAWGALSPINLRCGYRHSAEPSVYVDRACRGRGLGRALVRFLDDQGQRLGFHTLISRISGENESSMRLFESCGHVPVGRERQAIRKFDRWIDVVIYQKIL